MSSEGRLRTKPRKQSGGRTRVTATVAKKRIVLTTLQTREGNLTTMKTTLTQDKSIESPNDLSSQRLYHGTKANLNPGDLIEPGFDSNYGTRKKAKYVYLSATLEAATWGAELAWGEGRGRIYIVESTGLIEDDPNLTDKKFPGNPTKSYRTQHSLRVTGEVTDWQGHSPEQLKGMKEHLARLKELGIEAIED